MLSYFYCDFRSPKTQDPVNAIGSIIAQLCLGINYCPQPLMEAYERSRAVRHGGRRLDMESAQETLRSICQSHKVAIVIDALDECDSREDVMATLLDLSQRGCSRIFVTSRAERDISLKFQSLPRISLESKTAAMTKDINIYISNRLIKEQRLSWLKEDIRNCIIESLEVNARGM